MSSNLILLLTFIIINKRGHAFAVVQKKTPRKKNCRDAGARVHGPP